MTREEIEEKMHEAAEEIKPLVTTLVEALCEAHQKGYLAGVELGVNIGHPHWIPVEDYPKVDISCTLLVHYVDGTIDICDYYGDYYDYTGENVTRNVTHWMPLPQPPRKEE